MADFTISLSDAASADLQAWADWQGRTIEEALVVLADEHIAVELGHLAARAKVDVAMRVDSKAMEAALKERGAEVKAEREKPPEEVEPEPTEPTPEPIPVEPTEPTRTR